jgi:putative endonuclease
MQVERGRLWEARAAEYLEAQGLRVVARGYRCRVGELDLVCRDDRHLVVVEVRARSSDAVASAIESIGPRKQRRIVQATRHLLLRHREWHATPVRFDVVAFDGIDGPAPQIRWIRNAFDAS